MMTARAAALLAIVPLLFATVPARAQGVSIRQQTGDARTAVSVQAPIPSYAAPAPGYLYGPSPYGQYPPPMPYPGYGLPYPPPYPYYYNPYAPYAAYPMLGQPAYPALTGDVAPNQLIPAGRLMVMVDPVNAEVSVDGLRLTQLADLSYDVGLLVGKHHVSVKAGGREPYENDVDIPGGQRIILTIRLKSP